MSDQPQNPESFAIPRPEGARYLTFRQIKIGVKPGFLLRKVGQAYMVMPTGPRMKEYQGMITLNETGAFLFKESQKPDPTEQKLIDACKAEYGASDEDAAKAVDAFVHQCAECGLFEYIHKVFDVEEKRELTDEELETMQKDELERMQRAKHEKP